MGSSPFWETTISYEDDKMWGPCTWDCCIVGVYKRAQFLDAMQILRMAGDKLISLVLSREWGNWTMKITAGDYVAVSQNEGNPNVDPKVLYSPYHRDPQKGTPNYGKPPCRVYYRDPFAPFPGS